METQLRILFGLLTATLVCSQLIKLVGAVKRTGSLLDRLQAHGTLADGLAFSVAVASAIVFLRRRMALPFAAVQPADDTLVTLPDDRLGEAAAITAAAFAEPQRTNNWIAVCGGSMPLDKRHQFLRWLFERNFELRPNSKRAVFHGGRLVCAFMFVTPDEADIGLMDMLRGGLLKAVNVRRSRFSRPPG